MAIEFWGISWIEVIYLLIDRIFNTNLPNCVPRPIERSCVQKLPLLECKVIGGWVDENKCFSDWLDFTLGSFVFISNNV